MRVRIAVITLLMVFFSLFYTVPLHAEAATQTVDMQGQVAVTYDQNTSELRLKVTSSDAAGWLLEVILHPSSVAVSGEAGDQVFNMNGTFTLGVSNHPLTSGSISGWCNSSGYGEISLSNQSYSTSLFMAFTISEDASVAATVGGQWPVSSSVSGTDTSPASSTSTSTFWYISRTSALLAYLLLFINITLGLGLKTRYFNRLAAQWQKLDLHHFTAYLALGFIFLHVFSLLGDHYFNFGLTQLLVPFNSPYHPAWTALGTLSFYILLIIMLSSLTSQWLNTKAWRILHYFSFAAFFAILFHAINNGTETRFLWAQVLYVATGAIVVFMCLWRFLLGGKKVPTVKQTNPA
jgi:hypothetical protein